MGSLKTRVRLENRSKITVFLDIDIEINVMTKEIIKDMGLAMRRGLKLELRSYTSHSYPFFSFCEDVKVIIRGLKIRYPIFIVEYGNYNLILGQTFLNLIKFS